MTTPSLVDVPVIVIAGPTGVGKTAVTVELAKRLKTEILNCDSMQVYQHLSVGTAKPTLHELDGVICHLIDHVSPEHQYNLGDFLSEAEPLMARLRESGKCPIVSGGTGMYIKGLLHGVFEDFARDPKVRSLLEDRATEDLFTELQAADLCSAEKIAPQDRVRIIRALEVWHATGKRISDMQTHAAMPPRWPVRYFVLNRPREVLRRRIDLRVDMMMREGLLDEVRAYLNAGYSRDNPAVRALGYGELIDYLQGRITLESALDSMKTKSRQYAKRQLTWFRAVPYAEWLEIDETDTVSDVVERLLKLLVAGESVR